MSFKKRKSTSQECKLKEFQLIISSEKGCQKQSSTNIAIQNGLKRLSNHFEVELEKAEVISHWDRLERRKIL